MLRTILAGALTTFAFGVVTPALALSVAAGTASTFSLIGAPPEPGPARSEPIGPEAPGPGEITVGLAHAGYAVQVDKLHVYERTRAPIAFKATAIRDGKASGSQIVCGQVDMDTWVTFPADTEAVRLSDFQRAKPGCGR